MDKEKLNKLLITAENASNNDLFGALKTLESEFTKTKELIINLTRHLDSVGDAHKKLNEEYNKRKQQ